MTKEQFVEAEHPRDGVGKFRKLSTKQLKEMLKIDYGKFVKSGETTIVTPEISKGEYKGSDKFPKTTSHYIYKKGEKPEELKDIEEIYGEEFKGYKGQGAIDKVLHEKSGHVKNAFYKPEVGEIDIIWGNGNIGLKHLIKERLKESKERMHKTISMIAETIEKSVFKDYNVQKDTYRFEYKKGNQKYYVIIAPSYHGKKATYVLTGFFRP